ncbi:MAG: hypothetical protein Q8L81_05710 [Bacteroidota bacterium]|nr:hypothetical protein [Bacteroidota bacterium]
MSHRIKIIKEWVDVNVTAANQIFKESFEVDKHVSKIIGIAFTTNNDSMPYYRGSQKISINEKEIYPEGYESKILMQGFNVPVNERIISLGEELEPGNRRVEIEYKDENHLFVAFSPYKVRLYVYSRIDD